MESYDGQITAVANEKGRAARPAELAGDRLTNKQNETGMRQMTAAETIARQITDMQAAIELLQSKINEITSSVDADAANWRDVGKAAMTAELARGLVAAHNEN